MNIQKCIICNKKYNYFEKHICQPSQSYDMTYINFDLILNEEFGDILNSENINSENINSDDMMQQKLEKLFETTFCEEDYRSDIKIEMIINKIT